MEKYPPDWDQRRQLVYERDNYQCQNCGRKGGRYGNAELHAHHVVPKSKGGTHRLTNLQTVCAECHERIHGHPVGGKTNNTATGNDVADLDQMLGNSPLFLFIVVTSMFLINGIGFAIVGFTYPWVAIVVLIFLIPFWILRIYAGHHWYPVLDKSDDATVNVKIFHAAFEVYTLGFLLRVGFELDPILELTSELSASIRQLLVVAIPVVMIVSVFVMLGSGYETLIEAAEDGAEWDSE